uniref:Uncharacterized protein n=1 Tax=Trichogramma kaykai TaxID=54128 RepID=A0ABD2XRK2_9HYME
MTISRTGLRSSKRRRSVSKDTLTVSAETTVKARPRRTQTARPPARLGRRSSRSRLFVFKLLAFQKKIFRVEEVKTAMIKLIM